MIDKLYMWVAWRLPARLVKQCCTRERSTRPNDVAEALKDARIEVDGRKLGRLTIRYQPRG